MSDKKIKQANYHLFSDFFFKLNLQKKEKNPQEINETCLRMEHNEVEFQIHSRINMVH